MLTTVDYIIVALCIAVGAWLILYNGIATPKQQAQALSDLVEESLSDAEDMRAHEFQANHAILHTDDPNALAQIRCDLEEALNAYQVRTVARQGEAKRRIGQTRLHKLKVAWNEWVEHNYGVQRIIKRAEATADTAHNKAASCWPHPSKACV